MSGPLDYLDEKAVYGPCDECGLDVHADRHSRIDAAGCCECHWRKSVFGWPCGEHDEMGDDERGWFARRRTERRYFRAAYRGIWLQDQKPHGRPPRGLFSARYVPEDS